LFANHVEPVLGDLLDPAACEQACHAVDTVIHVGGLYRFGRRHQQELETINVTGTDNLLRAAWNNRVTRFVHISSASVLDGTAALVDEDDFPKHVPRRQAYRHSKWHAECLTLDMARRGLPVVIVNPSVPLGPEDETPTPSGRMVVDFLEGRFPFSVHTHLNIVHVADLADGIVAASVRGHLGERYLLGHHNVSLGELLHLLARASEQSAPRFCLPWGVVAVAGLAGEVAGSDWVCWETASHARRCVGYSSWKATEELGWRPRRSLEQTVSESVAWFRQNRVPLAAVRAELPIKPNVTC